MRRGILYEGGEIDPLHRREHKLLLHEEPPQSEGEVQILLAEELYRRDHPFFGEPDKETRNKIISRWIKGGDRSYAHTFRNLIKSPDFKNHHRLQGNHINIMLSDLDYFLGHKSLPEP